MIVKEKPDIVITDIRMPNWRPAPPGGILFRIPPIYRTLLFVKLRSYSAAIPVRCIA